MIFKRAVFASRFRVHVTSSHVSSSGDPRRKRNPVELPPLPPDIFCCIRSTTS